MKGIACNLFYSSEINIVYVIHHNVESYALKFRVVKYDLKRVKMNYLAVCIYKLEKVCCWSNFNLSICYYIYLTTYTLF